MFQTSFLYEEIKKFISDPAKDVLVLQGGTSSGKTYTTTQVLDTIAVEENNARITVVGQDIPNLKVGAMRDQENIARDSEALQSVITDFNKTDRRYTFATGSFIEFKSYKDPQDAKSGKRDYTFINEANGITYEVFNELYMRTEKKTILDYNPNSEFWVHRELIGRPNVQLIISDHRHNPFLPEKQRIKIEGLKDRDIELWKVYARGLTGKIEGLVFRNYRFVTSIPAEARFIGYWLDFGFTNDPTSFGEVYLHSGELWLNELIYETGMTNQDIARELKNLGISKNREIIADSAEPKSIEEISRFGYNIRGTEKGKDSIKNSIDILKRYWMNITERSVNTKKEVQGYRWKTDKKSGLLTNEPVGVNDHSIAGIRYVALMKLNASATKSKKYTVR